LPEVWEPGGESEAERKARERVARLEAELESAKGKAQSDTLERLVLAENELAKEAQERLRRERSDEDVARKRGLVTREEHDQRESDREDWRLQVIRWRLGENDVRQLVELMMAALPSVGPGRICFDDEGELHQSGLVSMSAYLAALVEHIELFLAMLTKCERNGAGDYLLRDSVIGYHSGVETIWKRVTLLAAGIVGKLLPSPTLDHRVAFEEKGVVGMAVRLPDSAKPLADTMRQLSFTLLWNADRTWVTVVSASRAEKIRAMNSELAYHRVIWANAEGVALAIPPSVSIQELRPLIESLATNKAAQNEPQEGHSASGSNGEPAKPVVVKEPSKRALAAFRLMVLKGVDQTQIGAELTRMGMPATQGCVSRDIQHVRKWLRAGNILPELPGVAGIRAVDPSRLEIGKRTDPRSPRPSELRGLEEDSDY